MTQTTKSDVLIPEIWNEAVQAEFSQSNVFMGTPLAQAGIVAIRPDFPVSSPGEVGDSISIPYFGSIGEFADISTDGDAAVIRKLTQSKETCTAAHKALAFETTRWSRSSAGGDIYEEGARQIAKAAERAMDSVVVAAAVAAGSGRLLLDKFSSSAKRTIDYDLVVDGQSKWGDAIASTAGMVVHSRVYADMLKLKDGEGRPLLVLPTESTVARFVGSPVFVSDRTPLDGSTMAAVVAAGTSPPTVTLTGEPNRYIDLRIECTTLGARGTSKIKYSIDGGTNFSDPVSTAATLTLYDPESGEDTGVTLNIATGSAAVDNVWTSASTLKHTTLLLKRGALAFWYARNALTLQTQPVVTTDSVVGAMHLYYAAYRYKRIPGSTKPGVVAIRHN